MILADFVKKLARLCCSRGYCVLLVIAGCWDVFAPHRCVSSVPALVSANLWMRYFQAQWNKSDDLTAAVTPLPPGSKPCSRLISEPSPRFLAISQLLLAHTALPRLLPLPVLSLRHKHSLSPLLLSTWDETTGRQTTWPLALPHLSSPLFFFLQFMYFPTPASTPFTGGLVYLVAAVWNVL